VLDPILATRRRWTNHTVALGLVFGVLLAFVGTQQVVSADEGAALLQAKVVTSTGQWALPAVTQLDPTGKWFPIHLSNSAGERMFPFSRPPIYPTVIRPLLSAGGLPLVLGLHVVALLLAALFAGLLTERVRPGRGIQAMWLTGLLSPLLFDGYWVIAHSIVAAGAALAVLGAVKVVVDGRARWLGAWFVGLGVAVLFRNEPLIFAVALAVALGLYGLLTRGATLSQRGRGIALGVASLAVAGAGYWISTLTRRLVEDSKAGGYQPDTAGGVVAGRWRGFQHSVLGAGSVGSIGPLLVVLTLGLVIGTVVCIRFEAGTPRTARTLAWAAAGTAILRLLLPADLITGLLLATPVLIVAALCVPGERLRDPALRIVAIAGWLTVLGVTATQHDTGGAGEWGGRYYHVALPMICILAVVTFDWILAHRGTAGRAVVAALLIAAGAYGGLAMRESRDLRNAADVLTSATWRTAETTESAHQAGGPVVVSSWIAAGRFAWDHILDGRYLTVSERRDLPELGERLADAGVPDFTFLAQPGDAAHLGEIGSGYHVAQTQPLGTRGWSVNVLTRS